MLILFASLALAKSRPLELLVPVQPPRGSGKTGIARFVPLPAGASSSSPWISDFSLVYCHPQGEVVAVGISLDPNDWPYSLPAQAMCTQGTNQIMVKLGFRQPEVRQWEAADGTIVVPHQSGTSRSFNVGRQAVQATRASVTAGDPGIDCQVAFPGMLQVDIARSARPGVATCTMSSVDGQTVEQKIVVVGYLAGG